MATFNFQPAGVTNQGPFVPDNLLAGSFPTQSKTVTIKQGFNLVRGTILEEMTAGDIGKFRAVTVNANARYVLAEDVNSAAGDVQAPVYITGTFNRNEVVLGAGATLAGVTTTLEPLSIFLVDTVQN